MIRYCIIAAALILSLTASAFAQNSFILNLQVGGAKRAALIRVPTGLGEKPPVVFYVHGATDSGGWFQKMGSTDATADREKYICIYACAGPNCGSAIWQNMQSTENFPYFFALLDSVDARYKIDRNRVYMTGFSQGGFISFAAACFYPDIFAAVAPESGHINASASCKNTRPVPILLTWGASEGASSFLKDRDYWLNKNKCPTTGTMTKPYPASKPNSKSVRVVYGPCEGNTQVIIDSIIGQGHKWPSLNDIYQSDEVWNFFKQYSLSNGTDVHPQVSAKPRDPIMVSYASGMIRLGGLKEEAEVEVTDTKGKLIVTANTRQHQFAFKGETGAVYMVTLRGSGGTAAQKIIIP
ncbi:MAG: alpha/beta hydrolase-fold protein [Fibrobacteria bacterium]